MSFSAEVKEEISKLNTLKNKELVKAELMGYCISSNVLLMKNKIRFSTENEYNINRFAKLLSNLQMDYQIGIKGKLFVITAKKESFKLYMDLEETMRLKEEMLEKLKGENELKAFVRGAFLGAGSLTNPEQRYHLEVIFSNLEDAEKIQKRLEEYTIYSKILKRNKTYSIYMKDGEDISRFLAFIGASSSMLKFEEIRVIRDIRNHVNRKVNCETANLKKTVDTGVRQVEDIKLIIKKKKFDELPESLQEIAKLRIKNPSMSLADLGKELKEPIGKSGVNHRLKKLEEIAEELRK